ncbi:radical SAM family heme chaperone HemW [Myxococcota bacterium]|nr:radical SAM family heme chaperone HemW [Myxococcota bacterium]
MSILQPDFKSLQNFSIYIHFPVCKTICAYCDFPRVKFTNNLIDEYISALIKDIRFWGNLLSGKRVDTVYIGGGTPSLAGADLLKNVSCALSESFNLELLQEFTVEVNPDDASFQLLETLREAGVNRISMGIQTLHNPERIGRRHSGEKALEAISNIKKSGYTNFNADLIFGLPDCVENEFQQNLEILTSLDIPHLSVYGLTLGEHSYWTELYKKGQLILPEEESWINDFYSARDFLESHGYSHYEISNYAKTGYESRHNQVYWNLGYWLGLGSGSSSSLGNYRFTMEFPPQNYLQRLAMGKHFPEDIEIVTAKEEWSEKLLSGLRMTAGISVPRDWFSNECFRNVTRNLFNQDLIAIDDCKIKITRKGIIRSDNIIFMIIETLDSIFEKQ